MADDPALPEPWRRAESKSWPGKFYYFNKKTGEKSWERPAKQPPARKRAAEDGEAASAPSQKRVNSGDTAPCHALHLLVRQPPARKRAAEEGGAASAPSQKRVKSGDTAPCHKRVNAGDTAPCHALHLLVKHAGSRNPSSWRERSITISKDEAQRVLQGQRDQILAAAKGEGGGALALEAAFRARAKERSDCSSAVRGGCLGFFSFPRMQKAFSETAFALRPKELSGIVDGDSGLHIIYRVA